jgi:hypothetical protein
MLFSTQELLPSSTEEHDMEDSTLLVATSFVVVVPKLGVKKALHQC